MTENKSLERHKTKANRTQQSTTEPIQGKTWKRQNNGATGCTIIKRTCCCLVLLLPVCGCMPQTHVGVIHRLDNTHKSIQ